MSKKRLVYVIASGSHDYSYCNWMNIDGLTNDIHKATICMGLGGSDVSSHYYNQPDSGHLHTSDWTDTREYKDYALAIELKKPIVGTCKGMQWLAALAGGAVFQHINHPYCHFIETYDGQKILANSLHHNMADLSPLNEGEDYKLLAWSSTTSDVHIDGWNRNITCLKDPEAAWFKKINAFGQQYHPEMLLHEPKAKPLIAWARQTLDLFLNGKLS